MVPCFLGPFPLSTILSWSSHVWIYNVLLSKAHPLQCVNCILRIWKTWIQRPLIQCKFRKWRIWHHEFWGKAHLKQESRAALNSKTPRFPHSNSVIELKKKKKLFRVLRQGYGYFGGLDPPEVKEKEAWLESLGTSFPSPSIAVAKTVDCLVS